MEMDKKNSIYNNRKKNNNNFSKHLNGNKVKYRYYKNNLIFKYLNKSDIKLNTHSTRFN